MVAVESGDGAADAEERVIFCQLEQKSLHPAQIFFIGLIV